MQFLQFCCPFIGARSAHPPPLRKLFIVIIIFTLRLQQVENLSLSLSFSVYRNYNMTLSPFLWVYNDDILCLSLFHLKCLSLYFSSDISLFAFQVGRSNLNIWMYPVHNTLFGGAHCSHTVPWHHSLNFCTSIVPAEHLWDETLVKITKIQWSILDIPIPRHTSLAQKEKMQIYLMFIVVSQKPTERTLFRTKRRLNREIALKTTNKTKMYRKIPKRQATVRRQVGTFEKYFIFFSILSLSKFKSLSLYSFVPLFHVSKVVLFNSAQVNQNFFFSFYYLSPAPTPPPLLLLLLFRLSRSTKSRS